jgi:hypothetical protein
MLRQGSGIVIWFFSSHDFPVGGLVPPRKQPVPPVAHGPDRRLRLRRRHHLLKQLPDQTDGIDLVVVRPAGKLNSSARKSASHSRLKNGVASLAYGARAAT